MKIKEKVLKEVQRTYEFDDMQFIEIHKPLNTAVNVELPIDLAIDLTLAEVGKINEDFIKKLKEELAQENAYSEELMGTIYEKIDRLAKELKQELGIK